MSSVNSGVTGPKFTKFLHRGIIYTEVLIPIPFRNARVTNEGSLPFFKKLVAMATSLEIWEKEVQINYLHPKCFHSVKRL